MKKYETPDFDVTIYEVDNIITTSSPGNLEFGKDDPNGDEDWFG